MRAGVSANTRLGHSIDLHRQALRAEELLDVFEMAILSNQVQNPHKKNPDGKPPGLRRRKAPNPTSSVAMTTG